jgi:hypothetical protein
VEAAECFKESNRGNTERDIKSSRYHNASVVFTRAPTSYPTSKPRLKVRYGGKIRVLWGDLVVAYFWVRIHPLLVFPTFPRVSIYHCYFAYNVTRQNDSCRSIIVEVGLTVVCCNPDGA